MREDRLVTLAIDKPERDAFRLAFGENLKSRRAAARLSQDMLAARCFLRKDHISELERGGAPPRLDLLLLLADALDVSLGVLTDGLVAPTRAASLERLLAVMARQPESDHGALANASEQSGPYVLLLLRYLESREQVHFQGRRWRLGAGDGHRPSGG